MTTTAYDMHFIASDIAFTDSDGKVHTSIEFRKVKRIGDVVIGMAGCLDCMVDFAGMILNYVSGKSDKFEFPLSILDRTDRDFIVMIHINGACIKLQKLNNSPLLSDNITQVPTVIGSGSIYVQHVIQDCPNAVVAVLEAIKHDKYTDGDVKYCSIRRSDVHNLEAYPMSSEVKIQVLGLQQEIEAANEFMARKENEGKTFRASTEVFYSGNPSPLPVDLSLEFIKQGFDDIRADMRK